MNKQQTETLLSAVAAALEELRAEVARLSTAVAELDRKVEQLDSTPRKPAVQVKLPREPQKDPFRLRGPVFGGKKSKRL